MVKALEMAVIEGDEIIRKENLKAAFIFLVSTGVVVVLLLTIARIFVEFRGDPVERSWTVLKPNKKLGWQVKPFLQTTFYGKALTTDSNGFRQHKQNFKPQTILIAGPSSTFGWGTADEETYPAQLSHLLHLQDYQVINLGQIGYTVQQGLTLVHSVIQKISPKILVIAYGINELDYFRFFDAEGTSDELFFANGTVSVPWDFLPLMLLSKHIGQWKLSLGLICPPQIQSTRVSQSEFLESIDRFKKIADEAHGRLILLSTAYSPLQSSEEYSKEKDQALKQSMNDAIRRGNCGDAANFFADLRRREPARIAAGIAEMNAAEKSWARKTGVQFIELDSMLSRNDFVDSVHFSKEGNSKVAKALFGTIVY